MSDELKTDSKTEEVIAKTSVFCGFTNGNLCMLSDRVEFRTENPQKDKTILYADVQKMRITMKSLIEFTYSNGRTDSFAFENKEVTHQWYEMLNELIAPNKNDAEEIVVEANVSEGEEKKKKTLAEKIGGVLLAAVIIVAYVAIFHGDVFEDLNLGGKGDSAPSSVTDDTKTDADEKSLGDYVCTPKQYAEKLTEKHPQIKDYFMATDEENCIAYTDTGSSSNYNAVLMYTDNQVLFSDKTGGGQYLVLASGIFSGPQNANSGSYIMVNDQKGVALREKLEDAMAWFGDYPKALTVDEILDKWDAAPVNAEYGYKQLDVTVGGINYTITKGAESTSYEQIRIAPYGK